MKGYPDRMATKFAAGLLVLNGLFPAAIRFVSRPFTRFRLM